MKITGILVPQDDEQPLQKVEFERGDIRTMQGYVGGTFDVIDIDNPPASIWFDDEGKIKAEWTPNRRATLMLWVHSSAFRNFDVVAGNALLTGPPDKNGDTTSAPDHLLKLLFERCTLKVEVQTEEDGPWNGNEQWFADWESAYIYAVQLAERWSLVKEVRVVEVEQPE